MPSQTLTEKWSQGSDSFSNDITYTGDSLLYANIDVPASTTNKEVDIAFTLAQLVMITIVASVAMTLKTNSTGSPQETITLAAGRPFTFANDDGRAAAFAGSVTKFYFTNAGLAAGTVKIRGVLDITP